MDLIRAGSASFRHVEREDEGALRRLDNGLFGEGAPVVPGQPAPQRHMLQQDGKHYLEYRWDAKMADEAAHSTRALRRIFGAQEPGATENFRLVLKDEALLEQMQEALRPAALRVFGEEGNSEASRLSHVYLIYATLNLPGQVINLHLDVPEFVGLDRSSCPNWLLSTAHCSGLFNEKRVRNVTCVFYPQDSSSGKLAVYPSIRTPRGSNSGGAVVLPVEAGLACAMDADSCFHHSEQTRPADSAETVPAPSFAKRCSLDICETDGVTHWIVRDADTGIEVARHPEADVRISISCKFHVFGSQAEADAYARGGDAGDSLDGAKLIAAMAEDLRGRGRLLDGCEPSKVPLHEFGPRLVQEYSLPVAPSKDTIEDLWRSHRAEFFENSGCEQTITVLDGSTGRQLITSGMPEDELFQKLWSARGLVDERYHSLVVATHRTYIDAGAEAITTNSYCVQPTIYRRNFPGDWHGRMAADAELAGRLALQARAESGKEGIRILGCLPPLCESHRPDLFDELLATEGEEWCVAMYRTLAEALLKGGADAFLAETMNSWEEAMCAVRGCETLGLPILISLEGALRGSDLQPRSHLAPEMARRALALKREGVALECLSFNCTEPEIILECLRAIEADAPLSAELRAAGVRLGAYANLHDRKAVHAKGFSIETETRKVVLRGDLADEGFEGYLGFTESFVKHGAEIVGGCCGCGPEGIRKMAARYREPGQQGQQGLRS